MNYKNCPKCGRPTPLKEKVTISDGDTLEIIKVGTCYLCKKIVRDSTTLSSP